MEQQSAGKQESAGEGGIAGNKFSLIILAEKNYGTERECYVQFSLSSSSCVSRLL